MSKIYVGDIGTEITIDVQEALATATGYLYEVLKPNTTSVELWTATVSAATKLTHTTTSTNLSVDGTYKIQALVTFTTWAGRSETISFRVYKIFE